MDLYAASDHQTSSKQLRFSEQTTKAPVLMDPGKSDQSPQFQGIYKHNPKAHTEVKTKQKIVS